MDGCYLEVRQRETRVQLSDGGIVPTRDRAQVNAGENVSRQMKLAGRDPVEIDDRNDRANDYRELRQSVTQQLGVDQRRIGNSEIHDAGLNFGDPGARSDRLETHMRAGCLLIGFRPTGHDRKGERRARSGNVLGEREVRGGDAEKRGAKEA